MGDYFLKTPSGKICYQKRAGKGEALIFLHGGGGSISSWDLIKPYFAKTDYTLVFLDLRGHGRSFRPKAWEDYQLKKHAEDVFWLMRALGERKVILIGHCLGSMVAATFAACYPQKMKKLILINPGEKEALSPLFRLGKIFTTIMYIIIVKFGGLAKRRKKDKISQRVDYRKFQGSSDFSLRRLWADGEAMGWFSALAQGRAFFAWRGREYFSKINLPTLIIGGKKDIIFKEKEVKKIAALIPGARVEFIESGHVSVINNPKEVFRKVFHFLERFNNQNPGLNP